MLFWMLQIGTRESTTAERTSMTYTGREKAEVSLAKCTSQHKERPEDWSLMREKKCIQFYEIWLLTFLCVKKKSNAANIIYGNSWILECIRIIKNPQNASFFDVSKLLFYVFSGGILMKNQKIYACLACTKGSVHVLPSCTVSSGPS